MRFRYQSQFATAATEPRFEVVPLLDCVFQLLIFALYALVLMVHAHVLPVKLPTLASAEPAKHSQVVGITLDQDGKFYLNQKPIEAAALRAALSDMIRTGPQPHVYVAVDDRAGPTDRGPAVLQLIDTMRQIGIKDFSFVASARATNAEHK